MVSGRLPWGDEDALSAADTSDEQVPGPRTPARTRAQHQGGSCDELTEDDREWARRTVAGLPPLTDRQRDILALLLRRRR